MEAHRTVKTNPYDNHRNEPQTSQQFTGNRDKRFDGKPSVITQEYQRTDNQKSKIVPIKKIGKALQICQY